MLALLSEQLNERLPPLMDNYVNDSKLLNQHIKNATDAILSNIKEMLIDEKGTLKYWSISGQSVTAFTNTLRK